MCDDVCMNQPSYTLYDTIIMGEGVMLDVPRYWDDARITAYVQQQGHDTWAYA